MAIAETEPVDDFEPEPDLDEESSEWRPSPGWSVRGKCAHDKSAALVLADKLGRKLGYLLDQIATVQETARHYADWTRRELSRLQADRESCEAVLAVYAADYYGEKQRTVRLPSGDIRRTKGKITYGLADPQLLVPWISENVSPGYAADLIRVKTSVDAVAFRAQLAVNDQGVVVYAPTGAPVVLVQQEEGEEPLVVPLAWEQYHPETVTFKPHKQPKTPEVETDGNGHADDSD